SRALSNRHIVRAIPPWAKRARPRRFPRNLRQDGLERTNLAGGGQSSCYKAEGGMFQGCTPPQGCRRARATPGGKKTDMRGPARDRIRAAEAVGTRREFRLRLPSFGAAPIISDEDAQDKTELRSQANLPGRTTRHPDRCQAASRPCEPSVPRAVVQF